MPRGDGTGPVGIGRMTGRAAGYCAGFTTPGFANPYPGFNRGTGIGRSSRPGGHGRRNMFYATGLPGYARFGGIPPVADYYPGFRGVAAAGFISRVSFLMVLKMCLGRRYHL